MAQSSLLVGTPAAPKRGLLLAAAIIGAILLLYMLNGGSYYPALAIIGSAAAIFVYKAWVWTRMDRQWLIVPLVVLAIFVNSLFLAGAPRAAFHYGMVILFCAPCVPVMWREKLYRRGGFELYSLYFLWALLTVAYSLAPEFSIARLMDASLVFCAISVIVFALKDPDDVNRLVERFILGCGCFVVVMAVSAVALPRSITWDLPDAYTVNQQVERFRGLLSNPNDVGVLMLITVGPTLAIWNRFEPSRKKWLGAIALLAVAEAGIADSRTPFVALAVGIFCYVLWRYRLRGILLLAGAGVVAVAALPLLGHSIAEYTGRGDVTTLTGRTDMWAYVVQEIKSRPFFGYGYEVAGAIFQSKYFPLWYGPWDEGPQSSLHNGYLNHMIGVGIPATLFWLFIVLRPWWFALRRSEDPWNLKPLALLVVIPCLIHNMSEASIGDFLGSVGLLFGITWAIGERYRLLVQEQAETARQKALNQMPPAMSALQTLRA
jgi:O-antigen ligase